MAKPRPEEKREPQAAADNIKILPMELRVGNHLSNETGEWEVIAPPYSTAGRVVHARVQRIDQPASWEIRSWDAFRRSSVKRA
jgi:hypothetical protein